MLHESLRQWTLAGCAAAIIGTALPADGAQNFWFRPDTTGAGCPNADGRSYANAWCRDDTVTGPGAINWSQLESGSVLWICGVHDLGLRDRHLHPTRSNITIDGRCENGADPGFLLAGYKFSRTVGTNVYSQWVPYPSATTVHGFYRSYGGSTGTQVIEDADNNSANRLTGLSRLRRQTRLPDATWPCGSFYQTAGYLYYKPTDCSLTMPDTVYAHGSDPIRINGLDRVTVRNLSILNADRAIWVSNSRNTRIEGNYIRWISNMGIRIDANSDHGQIISNEIRDIANGIYLWSANWRTAKNNDFWLIVLNRIHRVDQESYYYVSGSSVGDNHAIGVQGGSWNEIAGNRLHNIADSAITMYNDLDQEMSNNRIHHNYIHDVIDTSTRNRNERGIEYGNGNRNIDPSVVQNNVVDYNVLRKIDKIALRTVSSWWSGQICEPGECTVSWRFTHNTIHNAGTSFEWGYTRDLEPEFVFEGNISHRPIGDHLRPASAIPGTTNAQITIGRNVMYPDGALFRWESPNNAHANLAAWSLASGRCRTATGILTCRTGNPLFVGSSSGTFHWNIPPYTIPGGGDYSLQSGSSARDIISTGDYDMDGASLGGVLFNAGAYERF